LGENEKISFVRAVKASMAGRGRGGGRMRPRNLEEEWGGGMGRRKPVPAAISPAILPTALWVLPRSASLPSPTTSTTNATSRFRRIWLAETARTEPRREGRFNHQKLSQRNQQQQKTGEEKGDQVSKQKGGPRIGGKQENQLTKFLK
jgi:hypothetical protein